tara:strand:+ start:583 stop:798 length:216 start_codon:yes stop_codon:yes gene_type:complete
MDNKPNRPVDMSDSFKENGWEYCKYLITDPRSDQYMKQMSVRNATEQLHQDIKDASTKLETPLQEGEETKT